MSDNTEEAASELAKRARTQGKHAARNAGRATRLAAQPALEEVRDVTERVEDVAEEAVRTAKRVSPIGLSRLSGNTAQGFMALSVAFWAGSFAFSKFRGVYTGRNLVMKTAPKIAYTDVSDSVA